jgi:hypothetical protein
MMHLLGTSQDTYIPPFDTLASDNPGVSWFQTEISLSGFIFQSTHTNGEWRRNKMFGSMEVTKVSALERKHSLNEAAAKLLEFAENPRIQRWIQFPTAVVVLLAHPDALDFGAIYVYDRKRCVWLWVDFDDRNYGGYSPAEFDVLVNQCHFLRLVESPRLLSPANRWFVSPGQRPQSPTSRPV